MGIGLCVKVGAAVFLFNASGPLVWMTPGVALGLIAGAICLLTLARMPRVASEVIALVCLGLAVMAKRRREASASNGEGDGASRPRRVKATNMRGKSSASKRGARSASRTAAE